jgi:hypothetical protein
MKKLLIALVAVLVTAASYAQGTLNFNTRFSAAAVDAPVYLEAVGGPGPGPAYTAALYTVGAGDSLTLIPDSVTTFRDGSSAAALARYVNKGEIAIPGVAAGPVTLRMRAWRTADGSFTTASPDGTFSRGESGNFVVQTLGTPPGAPGDLPSSFTGFIVTTVPEPSTIALGVLGAAALLLRRRK